MLFLVYFEFPLRIRFSLFFDHFIIWAFSARVFFRYIWFWLFNGALQAYLFAIGILFLGMASAQLFGVVCDDFFVSFARHIHLFWMILYLQGISTFGDILLFFGGLFFLSVAFWLHFCVSRYASKAYNQASGDCGILSVYLFFPETWSQFFRVVWISFFVSFLTGAGFLLGVLPGVLFYIRLFLVFPILVDHPRASFFSVIANSWQITRISWRSILQFSLESFLFYFSFKYLVSYLFLVVVFPLARYALYRSSQKTYFLSN